MIFRKRTSNTKDAPAYLPKESIAASPEETADIVIQPPIIYGLVLLLGMLLDYFVIKINFGVTGVSLLGAFIGLSGIGINMWSMNRFRFYKTSSHPKHHAVKLIQDGPYRFSRNPLYLGTSLMIGGFGFAFDMVLIVIGSLIATLIVHYVAVLPEERYLKEIFDQEYQIYTKKVRRWI